MSFTSNFYLLKNLFRKIPAPESFNLPLDNEERSRVESLLGKDDALGKEKNYRKTD